MKGVGLDARSDLELTPILSAAGAQVMLCVHVGACIRVLTSI